MILKVTREGVTIPRRLLGKATEVEVRQENGRVVVVPVANEASPIDETLYEFGSDPADFGEPDASVHHDRYLYEDRG